MDTWDSLTPKELRNAKIFSTIFIAISILILFFLSKAVGTFLLAIGLLFGLGPFLLGSKGSIKNKIYVLKIVEPGYGDWKDEEIKRQIKAIEECGYKWFEKEGRVGFKHTKTGLYLKIKGLDLYKPEDIKRVYREVWSKDDPSRIRRVGATAQKMAKAISSGTTNEEIESILEEHQKDKNPQRDHEKDKSE